jgi:hypothetical protein
VRVDQCVSAVRAEDVPVFVWLRSSCNHATGVRFLRLALKVVIKNDGDLMDVTLIYFFRITLIFIQI